MSWTTFRYRFIESFLDKKLELYEGADFATKQKVRLFYPICIAGIIGLLLLMGSSIIIQSINGFDNIYFPILIAETILLFVFAICIRLLVKGFYNISTHLFITSANVCAWIAMFLSEGELLTRIDTVVLILAIINIIPLFITKNRWVIIIYVVANILIITAYLLSIRAEFNLGVSVIADFITDLTIALFFTGIAGNQLLKINDRIIKKIETDFEVRLKTERELAQTELKYKILFDNAQIGIFRSTPNGEIVEANPALVDMLGYESIDELVGKNLLTDDFFVDKDRSNYEKLMKKQSFVFDFESEWRKRNGDIIIIKENSRSVRDDKGNVLFLEGFIENITERKKIEIALKENEEKYRSLMDNMNDIVMFVDNNDKVLFVNKRFTEKLGYSEPEIVGRIGYEVLIDEKDRTTIKEANVDRTEGLASQYEATFIAKDGTKYDFLVSGAPVKDADGVIIGSIGNMIDITERKVAEEKLKESQQLFQTLAQSSPVGIFRTRVDGYTTYVNPRWMEISGLSFNEAIGDGWLDAVYPDDKKLLQLNWELKSSKGIESIAEYRFVKDDGEIAWVLGHAVPEIIDGKIQGFVGTITDITERKTAEKKIKESEERYRTIIEAFPDVIMISDLNRNILFANDALEKYTGIKPEDYTNKNRKAHIHPDDSHLIQDAKNDLLNTNKTHTGIIEHRFIDSAGELKWFAGTMSKMKYKGEIVLQTITRDITEKKQIEKELENHRKNLELLVKERTEELAATNEELVSTNEELHSQREELQVTLRNLQNTQKQLIQSEKMASLGVLASGVAHEINNPLNFIRGGAFGLEDYIKENLENHVDSVKIFIDSINEGVDRAATIVTSLNHYSHRDESRITECNIHDIIDNCLNILRNQVRDVINIEKKYTSKNYLIKCNEGKMHQAMLNIITNAIQSIEDKGTINIKTRAKNKQLQVEVSDTGCGISKENLPKVFDPFFTTKAPGSGTGLGLSITYNIIEEHNGNIEINSELYSGTNVFITLPIVSS